MIAERSQNDGQVFNLITHKFVGIINPSMPVHLTNYDGNSKTFQNDDVNLFANKLWDLQGKNIKVATMIYVPYDIYYKTVSNITQFR